MIGIPGKDHTFIFILVSSVVMTITITVENKSLRSPSPKTHILLKRLLNDVILRIVALECVFNFWKQTVLPNNI